MMRVVALALAVILPAAAAGQTTTVGALPEDVAPDSSDVVAIEQSDGSALNKAQISNLAAALALVVADLTDVDLTGLDTAGEVLVWDPVGSTWDVSSAPAMLTSTAVQDAQVPESSVTQHEAALSVTESQVSDLSHTTDTGPSPDCSGSLTYQDGDGGCDAYTLGGNTTKLATVSGSTPSNQCAKWDASGNLVTSGAACGGGGAATSIDADGDATPELYVSGTTIVADVSEDGATGDVTIKQSGSNAEIHGGGTFRLRGNGGLGSFHLNLSNTMDFGALSVAGSSSTTRPIVALAADSNTGVHMDGSDTAAFVVAGAQSWTCDNDGSGRTCWQPCQETAPTCDLGGEQYNDCSGVLCVCNGSSWTEMHDYSGTGTCS